jgi:VanZ family protein
MSVRPFWLSLLAGFFLLMVSGGTIPGQAELLSARFGDKLLHVLAYALMTLLCFAAVSAPPLHRAAVTLGVIALLGLADEAIQSLLPYRNASLADWCFDIATATLVSLLLLRTRPSTDPDNHA